MDRRAQLEKQREKMMEEYASQKAALTAQTNRASANLTGGDRFATASTSLDAQLKESTYGLVQLSDFKETREKLEELEKLGSLKDKEDKKVKQKKKRKDTKVKLSFELEGEDETPAASSKEQSESGTPAPTAATNGETEAADSDDAEQRAAKKRKLGKNPHVDTHFLPDREREAIEAAERERLAKEWLEQQEELKKQEMEVVCSYWDGSGHRTSVTCKKGDSIGQFLAIARKHFDQIKSVSVDNLMFIKEDLIIPHHYTFYDFIINKFRGKSGPLFNFDAYDDVRLIADHRIEKDESHAAKIVERGWYNKQKHIFPASRWELFNPAVQYEKYTVRG